MRGILSLYGNLIFTSRLAIQNSAYPSDEQSASELGKTDGTSQLLTK